MGQVNVVLVGLGGAVGAVLRYFISLIPIKSSYPFLTLLTNLLGAVLIGFVAGMLTHGKITKSQSLFLKTGVCGGFTTFSTFSLESVQLLEQGKYVDACSYMGLSLGLCILGVIAGGYLSHVLNRA